MKLNLRLRKRILNVGKFSPSVISAMKSSFKKCGFRRHVGPVHEGFHTLQVAVSETGDESTRDLEISMEDGDSNVVLLEAFTRD